MLAQEVKLPPGVEPLVLWEPAEGSAEEPVIVDTMLARWLRPHQREGVQFLFDCVTGLRSDIGQGGTWLAFLHHDILIRASTVACYDATCSIEQQPASAALLGLFIVICESQWLHLERSEWLHPLEICM